MLIGPIQPNAAYPNVLDVLKPLQVRSQSSSSPIFGDTTRPQALTSDALGFTVELSALQASAGQNRAMIALLLELAQNTEYQRAGIVVRCRDDGTQDAQDGWYTIDGNSTAEVNPFDGWANPQLQLRQKSRIRPFVGVQVVTAVTPDDIIGGGGVVLAGYPMGMDLTANFPPATFTLTGRNGSIAVVENPAVTLRAPVLNYETLMTQGRCYVYDEDVSAVLSSVASATAATRSTGANAAEVFFHDHRLLNGYLRITNDLLRYTLHVGDNAPLVEVWSGGAWVTVGSFQLQSYNGSTYSVLPLRGATLTRSSSEEIWWEEVRYDAAGSAFARVLCRVRRGSRIIEAQIVSASGLGLTGPQSVGLVAQAGTWTQAAAGDTSGVVWTQAAHLEVPGFAYLTRPAVAATLSTNNLFSGLSVPAGTTARIGVVAGLQDAIYTAAGTAAAYAAKQASYNRMSVKQRFLPG